MFEEDIFESKKKKSHKTFYAILVLSLFSIALLVLLLDSHYGWFGITGNAVTGNIVGDVTKEGFVEGTASTASAVDTENTNTNDASVSDADAKSTKKKAESLTSSFFDTKSSTGSSSSSGSSSNSAMQEEIDSIKSSIPKTKDLPVFSSLETLPLIKREVSVESLELTFSHLSTILNVNNDQFALNDLQAPTLKITDFTGTINLDASGVSLDGVVSKIEVNNVALYSSQDIRLVTGALDFSKLNIDEIFLGQVAFQSVTGNLNIADKLQYTLTKDQLRLYNFKGTLTVDKSQISPAVFDGIVEGVEVNGGLLRVNVQ